MSDTIVNTLTLRPVKLAPHLWEVVREGSKGAIPLSLNGMWKKREGQKAIDFYIQRNKKEA